MSLWTFLYYLHLHPPPLKSSLWIGRDDQALSSRPWLFSTLAHAARSRRTPPAGTGCRVTFTLRAGQPAAPARSSRRLRRGADNGAGRQEEGIHGAPSRVNGLLYGKAGDLLNNGGGRKAAAASSMAVSPGDPAAVNAWWMGELLLLVHRRKRREVAVCVPAEEVTGKSTADDGMVRGDQMEAVFGMAAHQDATPAPICLLFCPMRCSHARDMS